MMDAAEQKRICLEQVFDPKNNSFDFIRFFLALLVIFSHTYSLGGFGSAQILGISKESYGGLAVESFFIISGFLIARSWLNRKSLGQFVGSRCLRIFPGFWVCSLVTILLFAPIIYFCENGTLNQYFQNQEANPIAYFTSTFLLEIKQYSIAGLLKNNPYPSAFNGSLWTLIHEMRCYLMVALLGSFGLLRKKIILVLFLFLFVLLNINDVIPGSAERLFPLFQDIHLLILPVYFLSGCLYLLYASKVVFSLRVFLSCTVILLVSLFCHFYSLVSPLILPYIIFWLALKLPFSKFGKYGDFSYGVYLYGFPVQQLLAFWGVHRLGFIPYFVFASFLSIGFAIPSYLWIEKPLMHLKQKASQFLDSSFAMIKLQMMNPKRRYNILLWFISSLLALIFMDLVGPPSPGLDPSWMIALSRAHAEGLTWGKDIIFTYGPLSYLFFGTLVESDYLEMQIARYLLYFLWLLISFISVSRFQNLSARFLALLAFIFIPTVINSAENKFILIAFLSGALLTNPKQMGSRYAYLKYCSYGVLSIIFLLVKFNFGLLTFPCLLMALVIGVLIEKKFGNENVITTYLQAISWLSLGALSGLIIFFSPLSAYPFIAAPTALFVSVATVSGLNHLSQILQKAKIRFQIAQIIFTLGLISLGMVFNSNLKGFILGSLQITSGYSQSMSFIGPDNELWGGLILILGLVILSTQIIFANIRNAGFVIAFLPYFLMSFKHGFIRHDSHVLSFAVVIPAYISGLGLLILNQPRSAWKSLFSLFCLALFTASTLFFAAFGTHKSGLMKYYDFDPKLYLASFSLRSLSDRVSLLFDHKSVQDRILNQGKVNLTPSLIYPVKARSRLLEKTVDIFPVEVSIAEANHLNWHPAPIFQAYSAYTRWLDRKNLKSYQNDPPQEILYSLYTIDGRHPYFDQPQTQLFMLCNYKPVRGERIIIKTESAGDLGILIKRKTPICSSKDLIPIGESSILKWNQKFNLDQIRQIYSQEPGNILVMKVDIQYSLLGKLYNSFFRTPPIYLRAFSDVAEASEYRLVIDTAKSGIVIGSLPANLQQSLRDFEGRDGDNKNRAISFNTPNRKIFAPKIKIHFFRVRKRVSLPSDFDPQIYLKLYPDVESAKVDPNQHYSEYGFFEGRPYK
jgi:peptidoglycan/LPS O-acetylase OafA/YrhL